MSTISPHASTAGPSDDLSSCRNVLLEQWRAQLDDVTQLSMDLANGRDGDDEQNMARRMDQVSVLDRLLVAARRQLQETEAALRRWDDGTYGTCVGCRLSIPAGRLEALPAARFCVPCQQVFTTPAAPRSWRA